MSATMSASGFSLLPEPGRGATKLVIQIWDEAFSDGEVYAAFDSLLHKLNEGGASVVALTRQSQVTAVQDWLNSAGLRWPRGDVRGLTDKVFSSFERWTRDALLNATRPGGSPVGIKTLHEQPTSLDDWVISNFHEDSVDFTAQKILVDGGDSLVVDETYWLLGAGSLGAMIYPKTDTQAWDDALATIKTFIREPIVLGTLSSSLSFRIRWILSGLSAQYRWKRQRRRRHKRPSLWDRAVIRAAACIGFLSDLLYSNNPSMEWAHADMVVAVTGKSPAGPPRVLVAQPTHAACPPPSNAREAEAADAMEQVLSAIADKLRSAGLDVCRNPAPIWREGVLPYNNVVVQTGPDVVWLPVFAPEIPRMQAVDDANCRIWHDLGFSVIQVPGCYPLVELDGCIRCATLFVPSRAHFQDVNPGSSAGRQERSGSSSNEEHLSGPEHCTSLHHPSLPTG